jgi:hypothetical protein
MQVDNTKKFRLKVDACRKGRGIGGILEQQNDEGKWQPVSYYSSSLSKEERQYSATELECKALHDCILHYAVYLKYIPHFEVFSDHNALRYMVNSENATTNGRLMRYLLDLQGFNFAIYYRKGTENCDADAVSRLTRTTDQPIITLPANSVTELLYFIIMFVLAIYMLSLLCVILSRYPEGVYFYNKKSRPPS